MVDGPSRIAPPSMMRYCSRELKVCYADRKWQIRFLFIWIRLNIVRCSIEVIQNGKFRNVDPEFQSDLGTDKHSCRHSKKRSGSSPCSSTVRYRQQILAPGWPPNQT